MRPSQRRSDASANITRIVAAAREVFARDGATAPLNQVAAAAGLADATLYRHFPNRQVLAAAVYEDIYLTEIKPTILALRDDAPTEAYLDALSRLEDAMFEQLPLLASLGDLANLTVQLIMGDQPLFDDIILQLQAAGIVRPDLTPEEVATFVAMVTTASVAMNHSEPQRRRYLRLMADALIVAKEDGAAATDGSPGLRSESR